MGSRGTPACDFGSAGVHYRLGNRVGEAVWWRSGGSGFVVFVHLEDPSTVSKDIISITPWAYRLGGYWITSTRFVVNSASRHVF